MTFLKLSVFALLFVPALASAQRKTRGDKEANWDEVNKSGQVGLRLSNKDIENASPIKLFIDEKKDLKLSDDQLKQMKDFDAQLKEQNKPHFVVVDSLRKEMRPGGRPSDDDRERVNSARGELMRVLGQIRANYDSSLTKAVALLDESQRKTADELVTKQRQDTEEMLSDKLGRSGRESGRSSGGSSRDKRPPAGD